MQPRNKSITCKLSCKNLNSDQIIPWKCFYKIIVWNYQYLFFGLIIWLLFIDLFLIRFRFGSEMIISDPHPAKSFGSLRIQIRIRNTDNLFVFVQDMWLDCSSAGTESLSRRRLGALLGSCAANTPRCLPLIWTQVWLNCMVQEVRVLFPPVLRIRIRIRFLIHWINMFFGLSAQDPDPLVRAMDPDPDSAVDPDPDPSIIMEK